MSVNKVVYGNATLIDISDATAVASDVSAGKTFYLASGEKAVGTRDAYTWETKVDSTVRIVADNPNYISITNYPDQLLGEEVYRIWYGSTLYELETKYAAGFDAYYLGSGGFLDPSLEDGTNFPFAFYKRSSTQLVAVVSDPAGQIYLRIDKRVTSSGKNIQAYLGYDTVMTTSYTDTDVSITVAVTGTYKVSWMGYRNTDSGTSGSQLYVNGTAVGSAQTTFVNTYGQHVVLTDISLNAGDVLVVRARARDTSYYMGVGNLIIEEV